MPFFGNHEMKCHSLVITKVPWVITKVPWVITRMSFLPGFLNQVEGKARLREAASHFAFGTNGWARRRRSRSTVRATTVARLPPSTAASHALCERIFFDGQPNDEFDVVGPELRNCGGVSPGKKGHPRMSPRSEIPQPGQSKGRLQETTLTPPSGLTGGPDAAEAAQRPPPQPPHDCRRSRQRLMRCVKVFDTAKLQYDGQSNDAFDASGLELRNYGGVSHGKKDEKWCASSLIYPFR